MRVGTVVRHQGAIGNLGVGVVTKIAGSSGTAGFKFVAWETPTTQKAVTVCQYVVGEFAHLLAPVPVSERTFSDNQRVKRIKAYIARNAPSKHIDPHRDRRYCQ